MNPLLVIWSARSIPVCQHHFRELRGIDKLYVLGHTEHELARMLPKWLADHTEYDTVTLAPDDLVVSQQALDEICFQIGYLDLTLDDDWAITGWSNCDYTHNYSNVQTTRMIEPQPTGISSYDFLPIADVAARSEPFRVRFAGHTLFTMPRHLWLDDRFKLIPFGIHGGWASDYSQCWRLQWGGVPIVCIPQAFAAHMKLDHSSVDADGWKALNLYDKSVRLKVER